MSAPKDDATPDVSGDHVDAGVNTAAGSHGADEVRVDLPKLAPEQGDAKVDAPRKEAPKCMRLARS